MKAHIWDPGSLLQLSGSYWQTFTLHTGVKLRVFSILGDRIMTAADIAAKVGADVRGMEILLNALAALGLLTKEDQSYKNTPAAGQFLNRRSPSYIGHMIMHHHYLVEPWGRMDEAVKTGKPIEAPVDDDDDGQRREAFLMGMYNIASQQAPQIAAEIDLSHRKRLLDLGGGPGTYAIHFCKTNPDLNAVVFDLPTTQPFAEQTLLRHDMSDRISFAAGNFVTDDYGGPFDVVWMSHILHSEGPDNCARIIAKAADALAPGGIMLIHDFFLVDSMDGPLFPALFALNMLQATRNGQSYSEAQVRDMLHKAGVNAIERLPYAGPTESGILRGG